MDKDKKNELLNKAVKEIQDHPGNVVVMVQVLSNLFSAGYGYGMHQGHHDRDFPEV